MRPKSQQLPTLLLLLAALAAAGAAGPRAQQLLETTLWIAAGALALALPLGGLLALLIVKVDAPLRRMASVAVLAMLFIPLHLHAAAWRAGFGGLGWFTQLAAGDGSANPLLRGEAAVVWVHGVAAIPWVALIVGAALRGVDRRLEENALLSSSAPQVLLSVSLRHAAPAFAVASGWIFVTIASEMAVSDLFQVRTFAEEVYTQHALGLFDPTDNATAQQRMQAAQLLMGLTAVGLVAVAVLWKVGDWIANALTSRSESPWQWRPKRQTLCASLTVLILIPLVGFPLGNLFYKTGWRAVRQGEAWRREWSLDKGANELAMAPVRFRKELWQSTKLGAGVATGAVLVGGAIAWRMRRGGPERMAWLAALAVCLTTPGPLIGIGAIRLFNQAPESPLWFLSWLYGDTLVVVWAVQMLRAAPIAALLLWPVWQSVPRGLLDAARVDGALPWLVAARAHLPAIGAAWLAALAVSLGELSATLLVMPPGTQTMPQQLFNLLHSGVDDRVAAISLLMAATLATLAWGVQRLWSRNP